MFTKGGKLSLNKKALHKISYGLYIVCSKKDKKINGQIANSVFQVTAEPPTVAVSINKKNLTHEYIQYSKVFTLSILCEKAPMTHIGIFGYQSGRDIDKFKGIKYKIGKTGSPIVIDHVLAYIEAELINQIDVVTHTIFIGKIVDADVLTNDRCMTYEYYHIIKGGKSPKNAPTYIKDEKMEEKNMEKYVCKVCGYVYDPEKGDLESGIKPGTKFEDLPETWVCPVCGASKQDFDKE
jgi:flavin reductase (DIM6/NTAB) family NADH-FMN oxidoreductase RutF/rubredoxin